MLINQHCFLQLFHLQGSEYSQENNQPSGWQEIWILYYQGWRSRDDAEAVLEKSPLGILMTQSGCVLVALAIVLLASMLVDYKYGLNSVPFLCNVSLLHLRQSVFPYLLICDSFCPIECGERNGEVFLWQHEVGAEIRKYEE